MELQRVNPAQVKKLVVRSVGCFVAPLRYVLAEASLSFNDNDSLVQNMMLQVQLD